MRLKFWGSGRTLLGTEIIGFESKTYTAGRTENLFGIDGLNAEDGGEPTAAPPGITVATFNVYEFVQTLGDTEGQGSLACCISMGFK